MTEKEILQTLKKADNLLAEYKKTLQPAIEALAELRGDDCNGELGCHEEGVDTICLHRNFWCWRDAGYLQRIMAFEANWRQKLEEAGITNIHIQAV